VDAAKDVGKRNQQDRGVDLAISIPSVVFVNATH
jgi:hypothetical protein